MAAPGIRALALLRAPRRVRARTATEVFSAFADGCAPAVPARAAAWPRACPSARPAPLAAALAAGRAAAARPFASSAQPAPATPCVEAACPDHDYECWKCHSHWSARPLFFCPDCEAILGTSDSNADYFTIFEQPKTFDVDLAALEARYKHLQRSLHPDRFTTRSRVERRHSENSASLVNAAHSTLRDPLLRAEYLLNLRGVSIEEGARVDDVMLLAEVMEAREAVEDADGDPEQLRPLLAEARSRQAEFALAFGERYAQNDLEGAKQQAIKMRYERRLEEAIVDAFGDAPLEA